MHMFNLTSPNQFYHIYLSSYGAQTIITSKEHLPPLFYQLGASIMAGNQHFVIIVWRNYAME